MKKTPKILMLSTLVLLSSQGGISATESVFANAKTVASLTEKRSLPKVSVNLGELPKKHTGNPFKDTSTSIFKNYITWIYNYGITTGYTPTSYKPNNNVTRGEMAVFLWRLAGSPRYNAPYNVFTDVNQYKTQILWLSATRVTSGTGAHYEPNGKVTRGQMAAFLHRMAVSSGNASGTAKYDPYFRDAKKHMFANDIGWMKANGIADSCNTNYNPDANVTRGEMAAFLQRFYNAVNLKVNKTSLKVKNSTLYVGDTWKASDNFVSATDKSGKAVGLSSVQVRGQVDTTKVGTYTITYTYGGKTAQAKITVKANQTFIGLTKPTLDQQYVGDTFGETQLRDNIATLINKDGQNVLATEKGKVQITAKDAQDQAVELANLTKTAGTYTITYTYGGKSVPAQLTVSDANIPKLSADGKTVQFMNQTWSVIRNLGNGNYVISGRQTIEKTHFKPYTINAFFTKNDDNSNGYNDSLLKTIIDNWYNQNVKGTRYENAVQPVVLPNPTLGDMKALGILKSNKTDGSISNFWHTAAEKYRTAVDIAQGEKQAFALSTADLAEEKQYSVGTFRPLVTEEGWTYWKALMASGINNVWLRSPGQICQTVAVLKAGNSIEDDLVLSTDVVIPALVVHIP